jgi:hypothetical protein
MQTWEDYLADLKSLPNNTVLKKEMIESAEYWIKVKRHRGDR